MKISAILWVVGLLFVSAEGISQTVTVNVRNASLEKVFQEIEKQAGYRFVYASDLTAKAKKVTVRVKNVSVEDAIRKCFEEQPFTYKIIDKVVIVNTKNDNSPNADATNVSSRLNISGKVVNETRDPLPNANIMIQGTDLGTTTNAAGEFNFNNISNNATLVFSSIGYETQQINLNGKTLLQCVLRIKATNLDELQVIAYGQSSKRLNTGNVSTVKSRDIEKQPINNPLLALQGRVPGMEIQQTTGVAGGGIRVQIRGMNSISKATDPLFIVDGVPYASSTIRGYSGVNILSDAGLGNPFSFINPNDIESIDILKDADATAIYGSRGANGVVLITTKKGKAGASKLDINVQSGIAKVPKKMKLLDTRQYLDIRYEAFKNDGALPNPNADYDLALWDTTRYTDWQQELIGGTAKYNDIQASLTGGNANTQYLFGTTYHKESTVFPGDFNDQKATAHISLSNTSMDKKFNFYFSGVYNIDDNRLGAYNFTQMAMQLPPNAPPMFNGDGTINWAPNQNGVSTWPGANGNPAATQLSRFNLKTYNLIANTNIGYEIIDGLMVKASLGFNNLQMNQYAAVPLKATDPSTWATAQRYAYFGNNNVQSWIIEPQAIYDKTLLKGKLSALVGVTMQQNKNAGQTLTAYGFASDELMSDIKSATNVLSGISINTIYRYNAGFGRINYNWDDKYILNVSGRRDGSSRFGPENKFHNFGALGAAWIFSNENFFKNWLPQFSYGKIRGSYGITGNDQIGDYAYLDLYSILIGIANPYQGSSGLLPNNILTPDLQWEETRKLEAGISLGWLNDRVIVEASFYRNRSSNQIVSYSLPSITGFTSINKNLDALVQNMGLELELRTININAKDFRWSSSINFSSNRNKLLKIGKGVSTFLENLTGRSLNTTYVYRFMGVDPISGIYQFADAHGAPTFTPDAFADRSTLINLETQFFGGLENSIRYKGFQIDLLIQFVKRPNGVQYLFNYIPGYFNGSGSGSNQPVEVLNRWQKAGDVKEYQKFNQNLELSRSFDYAQTSDLVYADASYLRLRNMSVSWHMPSAFLKKTPVKSVKIFLQGQNLYTITQYRGMDPETQNTASSLPPLRTIVAGIQISL